MITAAPTIRAIPDSLKNLQQWVLWQYEERVGKLTKVPYCPTNPTRRASVTNTQDWGTFDQAMKVYEEGFGNGIGFVFTKEDPFCGIDLDKCRNRETGELEAWAKRIVEILNSYTEVSPSLTGVHIIAESKLPEGPRRKGQIEMYDQGRYFCMTGEHVDGTFETIEVRQQELLRIHDAYILNHETSLTDEELLEKARSSAYGHEFKSLWDGNWNDYTSQSEADLALCNMLAFWTGKDAKGMDRLFRRSGLYRTKWDEQRGDRTYGQMTIEKAISLTANCYHSASPTYSPGEDYSEEKDEPFLHHVSSPAWPQLDEAAYYGLPGEFTQAVAPHSEADPIGILLHVLIAGGCAIGSNPHVLVEHCPHPPRHNGLLVGQTAGGRKGTAWSSPKNLYMHVDPQFIQHRLRSSLSSGEGLIYQVRDPQYQKVPVKEKGRHTGEFEDVLVDEGEEDKRLLVLESEFATALNVMERDGSTLSPVIRDAWDHGNLSPMTKRDRMSATNAHISIIGHITQDELLRKLTATEKANGLANRFLIALVRRSQFLPSGRGAPPGILEPFFTRFSRTIAVARTRGVLKRDPACEDLWCQIYAKLEEEIPGLTGAILGRAAAQVLRLSLVYALLDSQEADRAQTAIMLPHLMAALAIWEYCKASVFYIFGDALGDPVADRLLRAIKMGPQTDTDLYELLGKHGRDRHRKDQALDLLVRLNRVHSIKIPTSGRATREWHYGPLEGCALCAKRV